MFKKDFILLQNYVQNLQATYRFAGLYHFTDFSNLDAIFKNGYLLSRTQCINQGINFLDGANEGVLNNACEYVHNCVRFYYREKTPTLYNNEGIKRKPYCNNIHIPIPVYLLFNENLIYLNTTKFSNGNATNSNIGDDFNFFSTMAWDAIFHTGYFPPEDRNYIINRRQAELLSEIPVPLSYLKKIIFRCDTDMQRAINTWGYDERYMVNLNLFSDKNFYGTHKIEEENNFIKSYNFQINEQENTIEMELELYKYWKDYENTIKIFDKHNNIIQNITGKISYKDGNDNISLNPITYTEKKILSLKNKEYNWYKLNVYTNDILCIEEYLLKYSVNYRFTFVNTIPKLHLCFKNKEIINLNHRYVIKNSSGEIIKTTDVNPNCLNWIVSLEDYNSDSWCILNYYIDDVLCISNKIQ